MQRFLNNWSATLLQPAAAADTEIVIAPELAAQLDGLGAGDHYIITLAQRDETGRETAWEIVRATARAAGTLTVLRQQDGTVAPASWPAGTLVSIRLTAAWAESILQRLAALEPAPVFTLAIGVEDDEGALGWSAGTPTGSCTPSSLTVPGLGPLPVNLAIMSAGEFVLEFSGAFGQGALQSVEVEGVGTLLGSSASFYKDSTVPATMFSWPLTGTPWAAGETRTLILTFNL